MSKSTRLSLPDVRALLQLVGECRDLGDNPAAWREHCCQRLARLTGDGLVILGEVQWIRGRWEGVALSGWGWENGFDQSAVARGMAEHGPDMSFSPIMGAYLRMPRRDFGVCLSSPDLVTERELQRSAFFESIYDPAGLGYSLVCYRALPVGENNLSGLTLTLPKASRRGYRRRDHTLVEEANRVLTPLIGGPLAGFTEPSPWDLSPRVRQVLGCLLEGDSDKQVAQRLDLTRHTVNQYAKVIFRHFGVRTRSELLARWVRRGFSASFSWLANQAAEEALGEEKRTPASLRPLTLRW